MPDKASFPLDPILPLDVGSILGGIERSSVPNVLSPPPPECPQAPKAIRKFPTPPSAGRVLICPIGDFPQEVLDAVARLVRKVFRLDTYTLPILESIEFAWDAGRGQYHSTPILDRLAAEAPPEAVKVAALCRVDLFIPILTYVFGEAQLDGKSCIVSSYRLADSAIESEERYLSRMAKEVVHELGHTFNLRHCPDPVCLMHYCRGESDVDHKSDQFCRYCKVLLEDALRQGNRL